MEKKFKAFAYDGQLEFQQGISELVAEGKLKVLKVRSFQLDKVVLEVKVIEEDGIDVVTLFSTDTNESGIACLLHGEVEGRETVTIEFVDVEELVECYKRYFV